MQTEEDEVVHLPGEVVDSITKIGLKEQAKTICELLIKTLEDRGDLLDEGSAYIWEDVLSYLTDLAHINMVLGYYGEALVLPSDFIKPKEGCNE